MKKKEGSTFEYEQERNEDLMRAYNEQMHAQFCSGFPIHLPTIYKLVAEMPSKRFWVSEERAAIVVSAIMRGDKLEKMRPTKRRMFQEICRRVMELKRKQPQSTILELTSVVCDQPAPEFYLTPKSIKVIIYQIKRQWYDKRKRKLRFL